MRISDGFLANSRNVSSVIVNASGKVPVALGWVKFSVFLILGLICFSFLGKIGMVVGTLAVVVGLIYLIRGYIVGAKVRAAARATATAAIKASETAIRAVEVGQALVENVVGENGENGENAESMAQRLKYEVEGRILKSAEGVGHKLANGVSEHTQAAVKNTISKLSSKLSGKMGSHRA